MTAWPVYFAVVAALILAVAFAACGFTREERDE